MEDKPQPRLKAVKEKRLAVARERSGLALRAPGSSSAREAGVIVDDDGAVHVVIYVPYHVWRSAPPTKPTRGEAA